jgi:hypothetical protein
VHLKDYHRKNLLEGKIVGVEDEDTDMPDVMTHEQEQLAIKNEFKVWLHFWRNWMNLLMLFVLADGCREW